MEPQGNLVKSIYLGLVMNAGFCFLGHQALPSIQVKWGFLRATNACVANQVRNHDHLSALNNATYAVSEERTVVTSVTTQVTCA